MSKRKFLAAAAAGIALLKSRRPAHAWKHGFAGTVFNAASYGVVGDGVTDNTTALFNLRTDALLINGPVIIVLPAGTVAYLDNRWLFGIKNVTVLGDPSVTSIKSLQNQTIAFKTAQPLWTGSPFITNTLAYSGTLNLVNGYLFNTVAAGSGTLTLTTIGDAANFAIGNRILLYGYEQTPNGYPPGPRYFEYHTINNIVGAVLTLEAGLSYDYNSAWADIPNFMGSGLSSGAPRVLLLDASYYTYPTYVGLKNLKFANNPFFTGTGICIMTSANLVIDNCSADDFLNSEINQFMTVKNSTFAHNTEFDKMCGDIVCTNTVFSGPAQGGLTGAYSSKSLVIDGCTINGAINVCPKSVVIKNTSIIHNSIVGSIWQAPAELPISNYTLQNLTLNSISNAVPHVEGLDHIETFNVDGVSGNNIIVNQISWADTPQNDVFRRLGKGTFIQKNDGTKTGTVLDVTYNSGAAQITIIINPSGGAPVTNETWQFRPTQGFNNLGGHTILDGNAFATFGGGGVTATFADL